MSKTLKESIEEVATKGRPYMDDSAIKTYSIASIAVSLKRIADALEKQNGS